MKSQVKKVTYMEERSRDAVLVISEWFNTSKDAIVGNDQTFAKFWD